MLRELKVDERGACLASDMRLRSDAVREIGRRWQWDGPVLEGNVNCDGRAFQAILSGPSDAADQIQATARMDAVTGIYSGLANIHTDNSELQNALIALGFTFEAGSYSYLRTNQGVPEPSREILQ